MPHGGKRPGAGRKPGTPRTGGRTRKAVLYAGPVRSAEDKIKDRLPELLDVALSMALDERNERMVVYCIDRIMGKPTQPISLVDTVRRLAEQEGLTDDETAEAVAEAERLTKAPASARS